MRLEAARLRVHRTLRRRSREGGAKGREGQDGQNRFLHEIVSLQMNYRIGRHGLLSDPGLPS